LTQETIDDIEVLRTLIHIVVEGTLPSFANFVSSGRIPSFPGPSNPLFKLISSLAQGPGFEVSLPGAGVSADSQKSVLALGLMGTLVVTHGDLGFAPRVCVETQGMDESDEVELGTVAQGI
jgi:hypothetical protein